MDWLNGYGLLLLVLLMVPNIVYGIQCPDGFPDSCHHKLVETLEQIGRFGCMAFMILNFPTVRFLWGKDLYLALGGGLMALYWLGWAVFWKENSLRKAVTLSILPSLLFLESGILTGNVLLMLLAMVFAYAHITISCQNIRKAP